MHDAVDRLLKASDLARATGEDVPDEIPHVKVTNDEWLGAVVICIADSIDGGQIAKMYATSGAGGRPRERLWHELEVSDEDMLVEKSAVSAFFPGRSCLQRPWNTQGIDTVPITGTVTNSAVGPMLGREHPRLPSSHGCRRQRCTSRR
jgi:hypothetical protein